MKIPHYLTTGSQTFELPVPIQINSVFNYNKLRPGPTWDFYILSSEIEDDDEFDEDSTQFTLYHDIIPGISDPHELIGREIKFSDENLGLNGHNVWLGPEEATVEACTLILKKDGEHLILYGSGQLSTQKGIIEFTFVGEAILNKQKIFKSDPEKRRAIYQRNREGLESLFEHLVSEEKQRSYKAAVPFVHIPYELLAQWDSLYSHPIQSIWFNEGYSESELRMLEEFNRLLDPPREELEDVPEIFSTPFWQTVMWKAVVVLEQIRNGN